MRISGLSSDVCSSDLVIDGKSLGRTDGDGALRISVPAGSHHLSIRRGDAEVAALDLELAEQEDAELSGTLYPDAAPSMFLDSALKRGRAVAPAPAREIGRAWCWGREVQDVTHSVGD